MRSALSPARALVQGIADVVKSPFMLMAIAILTIAIALPFAAVLHSRLQQSLAVQPPVSLADTEIDPEWWMEFREHARGLASTFTPAVLGFAATLDGLSGVLDGTRPPAAILLPFVISVVAWAFIWGGALRRFQQRRAIGPGGFVRAGRDHVLSFTVIAAAAALVNVLLYLTVHALLFGPIHRALVAMTTTERDAFLVRVVLYAVFFSLIALVSLIADYARVAAVTGRAGSAASMIVDSIRFVRGHLGAVAALFVMTGAMFVALTAAYGVLEIYGGSQIGGWRAIAIGQAYVLVRLAIRLTFAASELRLFNANHTAAAQ
jgi:hypothetical protein